MTTQESLRDRVEPAGRVAGAAGDRFDRLSDAARLVRGLREIARILWTDRYSRIGCIILIFFGLLAVFGPYVFSNTPWKVYFDGSGNVERLQSISTKHWLGTTYHGEDVLTQAIVGTRLAFVVGLITALLIGIIGTNIGLISGYFGGYIDDALMRITDVAYAIPFLPFMIVVVTLLFPRLDVVIGSMALVFWRTAARVVRSQVLSLKERPYVLAARASGASHLRVMYVHLLPNVLPLAFLYLVFGVAWAVLTEAGLSFLGLSDPNHVSWGLMLHHAFVSGFMRDAWWWVLPPGISLMLFLVGCYFIGRGFEEYSNPRLRAQ